MSLNLASGVASAKKSSTPASAAIAAAVSGLSPVIITVLMPILRSSRNRSLMPPLTISFKQTTPRTVAPSATASGVPPPLAIVSHTSLASSGKTPPCPATYFWMASMAPLRISRPFRLTPLIRVWALKCTNSAPSASRSRSRKLYSFFANTTMLRPSGVSSAIEAN